MMPPSDHRIIRLPGSVLRAGALTPATGASSERVSGVWFRVTTSGRGGGTDPRAVRRVVHTDERDTLVTFAGTRRGWRLPGSRARGGREAVFAMEQDAPPLQDQLPSSCLASSTALDSAGRQRRRHCAQVGGAISPWPAAGALRLRPLRSCLERLRREDSWRERGPCHLFMAAGSSGTR
jgi:hypothetical protein